jgi:hypothetical protein
MRPPCFNRGCGKLHDKRDGLYQIKQPPKIEGCFAEAGWRLAIDDEQDSGDYAGNSCNQRQGQPSQVNSYKKKAVQNQKDAEQDPFESICIHFILLLIYKRYSVCENYVIHNPRGL